MPTLAPERPAVEVSTPTPRSWPTADELIRWLDLNHRVPSAFVFDDGNQACAVGISALRFGFDRRDVPFGQTSADYRRDLIARRLDRSVEEVAWWERGAMDTERARLAHVPFRALTPPTPDLQAAYDAGRSAWAGVLDDRATR